MRVSKEQNFYFALRYPLALFLHMSFCVFYILFQPSLHFSASLLIFQLSSFSPRSAFYLFLSVPLPLFLFFPLCSLPHSLSLVWIFSDRRAGGVTYRCSKTSARAAYLNICVIPSSFLRALHLYNSLCNHSACLVCVFVCSSFVFYLKGNRKARFSHTHK